MQALLFRPVWTTKKQIFPMKEKFAKTPLTTKGYDETRYLNVI